MVGNSVGISPAAEVAYKVMSEGWGLVEFIWFWVYVCLIVL